MKIAKGPPGFLSLFMTQQNRADHTFWPHLQKKKQKMKTGWITHSWNNAIWLAVRPCHMTMTCKINKLEKPGVPQGNFHALFGRSPTFYSHFRADAVTSEWSTRISSSIISTVYFKIGPYKCLKEFPAIMSQGYHCVILEVKNYSHGRTTISVVLLITVVFDFFLNLLWEIIFQRETFFFGMKHILLLLWWDFFFPSETFSFLVTLFFLVGVFLSSWECLYWKLFYLKWKFMVNYTRRIWQVICSLCLVLWARPFYILEMGEC